ncbi:MAG: lysophospholipid acyltransferase family protein [Pseudoxanthomonas sp.]
MPRRAERACWFVPPLRWLGLALARLPQPLLLKLGALLAWLLRPALGQRARWARINLALCFPELDQAQREALLRANLRDTLTAALELLRAWYAPSPIVRALGRVEGLEHLQAAQAQGRGVLLLTGHFPHAELAARLVSLALGAPVAGVVRRNNDPCVEKLLDGARALHFPVRIGKKDMRGLLRVLQRGGAVMYSADQNFSYQNAFVPFFGVPAATLTAIPDLARRGNASVLPLWIWREDDGRYVVRIDPPWDGWPSGDPAADAARYMRELETVVRAHPSQYLWVHRRFKTRPAGEAGVY